MVDIQALKNSLQAVASIGYDEMSYELEGIRITMSPVQSKDEAECFRYAQEATERTEEEKEAKRDQASTLEYLDRFKVAVVSFAIIQIGNQDLRGVEFVETGQYLEKATGAYYTEQQASQLVLNYQQRAREAQQQNQPFEEEIPEFIPVRKPIYEIIREEVWKWSKPMLNSTFAKYGEMMERVELRAAKATRFDPEDLDSELARIKQRLAELEEMKEDQIRRVKSGVEDQAARIRKNVQGVAQATNDYNETVATASQERRGALSAQASPTPSRPRPSPTPPPERKRISPERLEPPAGPDPRAVRQPSPEPPVASPEGLSPELEFTQDGGSFIEADDEAAIAAETRRIESMTIRRMQRQAVDQRNEAFRAEATGHPGQSFQRPIGVSRGGPKPRIQPTEDSDALLEKAAEGEILAEQAGEPVAPEAAAPGPQPGLAQPEQPGQRVAPHVEAHGVEGDIISRAVVEGVAQTRNRKGETVSVPVVRLPRDELTRRGASRRAEEDGKAVVNAPGQGAQNPKFRRPKGLADQ